MIMDIRERLEVRTITPASGIMTAIPDRFNRLTQRRYASLPKSVINAAAHARHWKRMSWNGLNKGRRITYDSEEVGTPHQRKTFERVEQDKAIVWCLVHTPRSRMTRLRQDKERHRDGEDSADRESVLYDAPGGVLGRDAAYEGR